MAVKADCTEIYDSFNGSTCDIRHFSHIFVLILSSIVYLHHLFLLGVLLLNLSVRKFFSYVALLHIKKFA